MDEPIFISFASNDRKAADAICKAVERRGMNCWIATRNIGAGENFQEAITRAIRSAKVMILVFSAHANNSLEVKKEIALAGRYNVIVVAAGESDLLFYLQRVVRVGRKDQNHYFRAADRAGDRLLEILAGADVAGGDPAIHAAPFDRLA